MFCDISSRLCLCYNFWMQFDETLRNTMVNASIPEMHVWKEALLTLTVIIVSWSMLRDRVILLKISFKVKEVHKIVKKIIQFYKKTWENYFLNEVQIKIPKVLKDSTSSCWATMDTAVENDSFRLSLAELGNYFLVFLHFIELWLIFIN